MSSKQLATILVVVVLMAGATIGLALLLAPMNDLAAALPFAMIASLGAAFVVRWLIGWRR